MRIEEDEQGKTHIYMFNRDLTKIPCFRNTFLYSISSWVGVTLLTFLLTSKPKFAYKCGCASFVVVTLGYFTNCRISYENKKYQMAQIQQTMQRAAIMEGTEEGRKLQRDEPVFADA